MTILILGFIFIFRKCISTLTSGHLKKPLGKEPNTTYFEKITSKENKFEKLASFMKMINMLLYALVALIL